MYILKQVIPKYLTGTLVVSIMLCFLVSATLAARESKELKEVKESAQKPSPQHLKKVSSKSSAANQHSNASSNAELSEKDLLFIDLREAARKNDPIKAQQLAARLTDYPIQDYVEYFKLKTRLYDSSGRANPATDADQEVERFLQRYKDTGLADRLRNDWILVLGKRRDWQEVDRQYPLFVLNDDTQVKCYSYIARLYKGESPKQVAQAAKANLLEPKYFGDACPDAVIQLQARGGLTKAEAQAISRMAAENGLESLAKKIADDPLAEMVKLAKSNPSALFAKLNQSDYAGSSEQRGLMYGVVGQFLAKKLDPQALDAFKRQHQLSDSHLLSPESLEWKVRSALRDKDWKFVKESIETMPDWIRERDPAWTYWYGRALKDLKDPRANEYFTMVSTQFNFYGQLGLEELNKTVVIPPKIVVTDSEINAIAQARPAFDRAAKFYAMNLRTEGNREWNWELRGLTDRELIAVAEYGKRIGLLDRAVNTADRTKVEHNFSLRFPTPFVDKLHPITQKINLDVNWVYGLIRQESRFILAAKSSVGASGLMQVMPATGQFVAKKIGMTQYRPENLSEINTNLMIGSHYLNMVLNDLDGSWALASAAYNAGPSRPKQWRQTLKRQVDGAIFAETIPFHETRTYVKNVLSNSIYYANLNGKSPSLKEKLGNVAPSIAVTSNLP